MLNIKWNLHDLYTKISGQAEWANNWIKTRLSKMYQEGIPWTEALSWTLAHGLVRYSWLESHHLEVLAAASDGPMWKT